MYAIVNTGGKQYRVAPGDVLQVETLSGDVGSLIELRLVNFIQSDAGSVIGQPTVQNAYVKAEILQHGRTRSVTVFKKKRRKNYRRTKGHRQSFTQIRIAEVVTAS